MDSYTATTSTYDLESSTNATSSDYSSWYYVATIYCWKCGKACQSDWNYCPYCGAKLYKGMTWEQL